MGTMGRKQTADDLRRLFDQLRTTTLALRESMRLADGVLLGADQTTIFAAWEDVAVLTARVHKTLDDLGRHADDPAALSA